MKINLFGDSGEGWNDSISASECVNVVPVISKAKNSLLFKKIPGTKIFFNTGVATDQILSTFVLPKRSAGEIGVMLFLKKTLANVYEVWYIDDFENSGLIGTVPFALNKTKVWWAIDKAENGGSVMIGVENSFAGAIISLTVFAQNYTLTTFNFAEKPNGISYLDGFFFYTSTTKIYSTIFGGTTFDNARFGLVSSNSGRIVSHVNDGRELWVFCEKRIVLWHNAGRNGFPLLRNRSAIIDVGTISKNSIVNYGSSILFLGISFDGQIGVYRTNGYSAEDITPENLKLNISSGRQSFSYLSGSIGRSLNVGGDDLYIINFYSALFGTWVYNLNNYLWSKEESPNWSYSRYVYGESNGIFQPASSDISHSMNFVVPVLSVSANAGIFNKNEIHFYDARYNQEVNDGTVPTYSTKPITMVSNYINGEDDKRLVHKYLKLRFADIVDLGQPVNVEVFYSDDEGDTWISLGVYDIRQNKGVINIYAIGAARRRLYRITSNYGENSESDPGFQYAPLLAESYLNVKQLKV